MRPELHSHVGITAVFSCGNGEKWEVAVQFPMPGDDKDLPSIVPFNTRLFRCVCLDRFQLPAFEHAANRCQGYGQNRKKEDSLQIVRHLRSGLGDVPKLLTDVVHAAASLGCCARCRLRCCIAGASEGRGVEVTR
jgi:hypothetical protein